MIRIPRYLQHTQYAISRRIPRDLGHYGSSGSRIPLDTGITMTPSLGSRGGVHKLRPSASDLHSKLMAVPGMKLSHSKKRTWSPTLKFLLRMTTVKHPQDCDDYQSLASELARPTDLRGLLRISTSLEDDTN